VHDAPAIVPVILSGGSGTRLWPASRADTPKQLLNLIDDHTMLRATLDRVAGIPGHRSAVVVCSEVQASSCRHEMEAAGHGDGQVIVEPEGRNTAPAVAVAALTVDPGSVMLVMPADHVLRDHVAFAEAVAAGAEAAQTGALVTFGVVPTHPATGYGYIRVAPGSTGLSPVAEFVEKPDLPDAERFATDGEHLWNSGMFMFTAERYLEELARFEPDVAAAASAAMATAVTDEDGSLALDADAFSRSPSISIDYAVMERTRSAVVVPLDAGWSDVGSWASLMDVAVQDTSGNVIVGDVVAHDVDGSYLRADGVLLAVVGLSDVVAVTTPDAVLVAAKDRAEDVKQLVEHLRRRRRTEADQGPTAAEPWGSSEILARIGDGVVTAHTLRPGSTAGFEGGVGVVVEGTARSGGVRMPPGAVIDLGPDSEVSNPTDSDVTVLVTTWTTPDAADG
jgi:mannose-1-phosphate guanylyltransferase/mannose-6-phosphate isomerase